MRAASYDGNQGISRWLSAVRTEEHSITSVTVEARRSLPGPVRPVQARPVVVSLMARDALWRERANCRGLDPGLFFPERGAVRQLREAQQVCAGCVVRAQCLVEALERAEEFGVRGGMSERQRRRLRTRLPRWARCSRCGGRFRKVAPRQRFCGAGCPALGRVG